MTMIETDTEKDSHQDLAKWNSYIENYSKPESGDMRAREKIKPVFLVRNMRRRKDRAVPSKVASFETSQASKTSKGDTPTKVDSAPV